MLNRKALAAAALSLWLAPAASAVTIDWVTVGNPGNAADVDTGVGAVAETYLIGKYEVTNVQYAEFLNAKAASDPLVLYNPSMGSDPMGGITRSGNSGSFTYSAIAGRENMPVNFVSFYEALRFANWLHNGQGSGDTETGAYTLEGGFQTPSNGPTVTRNPGATIFLPSEDEWHKAAYHNAIGLAATDYFDYPAGFDAQTTCTAPTAAANSANCDDASLPDLFDADVDGLTVVGSFTGSASRYGTFDQGGNVLEWNEAMNPPGDFRGLRGGAFDLDANALAASDRGSSDATNAGARIGFRLAAVVPEPGTGLLVMGGMLVLAGWRRRRA